MGKCPDSIKRLIDRFEHQSDQLRSADYSEALIRIDFINPLMTELGWDIDNRQGFAEQYREVVHEDRVRVAGQTKATIRLLGKTWCSARASLQWLGRLQAVAVSSRRRRQSHVQHRRGAPPRLPALFIGSSAEGLKYARALEKQLEHDAEVTIWKDGVFGLGGGTLETLVDELPRFDFAALVLTADDLTLSRRHTDPSPRDNVVCELGLFMGHLGRFRTFIVYNKDEGLKLPSDLAGVTAATFRNRADGNYHAQISPPSTLMIDAIQKHGPKPRT